jgi:HlyD family secretion protein
MASFLSVCCLVFFGSCQSPSEIRGVKATQAEVEATVSSVNAGTVKAEHMAELAFGAVGKVQKLQVKFGDQVTKGQLLATLENEDLASSYRTAEQELKRHQALLSAKAISTQEFDQVRKVYDISKIAFENTLIHAPFDGLIAEMNLEVGQLSQITAVVPKPLLRIVDTAPRYVEAQIDEADLGKIKPGLAARIKILAERNDPFNATVRKVIPYISSVREQDRTAQIELDVDGEETLLPVGASADVEIIIDRVADALAIPTRTLLGRGRDHYVFALRDGKVKRTSVEVGLYNYDRAQILSGLESGTVVLFPTEAIELKDGLSINLQLLPWPLSK